MLSAYLQYLCISWRVEISSHGMHGHIKAAGSIGIDDLPSLAVNEVLSIFADPQACDWFLHEAVGPFIPKCTELCDASYSMLRQELKRSRCIEVSQ